MSVRVFSFLFIWMTASLAYGADVVPAKPAATPPPAGESFLTARSNSSPKDKNSLDDPKVFHAKLVDMYQRVEKTIKILREQILQNQSAPFLADLYLQLADLLSEKANVLYYQKIDIEKDSNIKLNANEKSNPIVTTTQEAIAVYEQILKEFPNFAKRDRVLYRLAVARKAIDEGTAFIVTAERLLAEFPKTKESFQVRLLLGQHYIDQKDFDSAKKVLEPARDCMYPFERNAARYRLGIIAMSDEKFKEGLDYFEKVTTDEELKEEDNPLEVSIKERTVKSNIKRDALIDSIRAYTEVFKKDPDPVGYYSRISPSEGLFQEVIEKLAFRYIFLKNELQAMKLLRNLSERVADPQKIVNIYREVLTIIPPAQRIEVPPAEMEYVLEKYSAWVQNFDLPDKAKAEAYDFFETQTREMGTRAHDMAKSELSNDRKEVLYGRAKQFYLLYLGFFRKSKDLMKIATDLADVYFFEKDYFRSGDLYLRIFQGEFGPPAQKDKELLIQNAILCFQKKAPNDFYEITRTRGLLLKAVETYMNFDTRKKSDPQLNFVVVKGIYEQGLYQTALPALVSYIEKFPNAPTETEAATDILLDYFNMRADFKGLTDWSTRILAIKNLSPALRTRLQNVKSKAMLKQIDEQVKSKANYDPFAQGKVYFETALNMQDETLRSAALEQALARSKSEKDINTFLRAARAMADHEPKADKKAQILSEMGEQSLAIGRFYGTLGLWKEVRGMSGAPAPLRQRMQEKILRLAMMLKDWREMDYASRGVNTTLMQSVRSQITEGMESAAVLPNDILTSMDFASLTDADMILVFKGMFKVAPGTQSKILGEIQGRCRKNPTGALCRWFRAKDAATYLAQFARIASTTPPAIADVEKVANALNVYINQTKDFSDSGDPQLDIFGSLYLASVYTRFAEYLNRVGAANPAVAQVLKSKANDSLQNATRERANCARIIQSASLVSPINHFCYSNALPSLKEAMTWSRSVADVSHNQDAKSQPIEDLQKKIFVDPKKAELYLELASKYLESTSSYRQAIALASYGASTFADAKQDFAAIQGCGLERLGYYNEAQFFLKGASDFKNLKATCWNDLKGKLK